jgi:hypothetical protein
MAARMPSGAAVVGPVALAATESVPAEVAAEVAAAPVVVQQHRRNYVPGRRADLEWGHPAEAAGTQRRQALGMRYSRAGRISLGSIHILAVGR